MILIPSTRWIRKSSNDPDWLLAVWYCPACGRKCGVSGEQHSIATNGDVTPALDCPHSVISKTDTSERCKFRGQLIRLEDWLPLYCIAFVRYVGKDGNKPIWKPDKHYCHARSVKEAEDEFYNSEYGTGSMTKVVAIGPVIGYHVKNRDATILSV
jgi:hypothetical protein